MDRWLIAFCAWLEQTPPSQTIQSAGWIVPTVQTIHILAISAVMASALMIDLRLFGILWRDQPLERVAARFLPFVWWPLLILFLTGVVMITGEPARALRNPVFQLKMALLVAALVMTFLLQRMVRNPATDNSAPPSRRAPRLIAVCSLLLWIGIIFAGRWIAYWA
jgi:uncharacterized membrane protein